MLLRQCVVDRLEGGEGSVKAARELLGGEGLQVSSGSNCVNNNCRSSRYRYLMAHFITWRCADDGFTRRQLIDWGGALRWLKSTADDNQSIASPATRAVMRPALVPEMWLCPATGTFIPLSPAA